MAETAIYEVLEPGGHAHLVEKVKDYVAENLPHAPVTKGTRVTDAFLTRVTGSGFPVGDTANVESIKGATVVWNQLAYVSSASIENVAHNAFVDVAMQYGHNVAIINGHKYLGVAEFVLEGDATNAQIYLTTSSAHGAACASTTPKNLFTASADRTATFRFRVNAASYPATFGGSVSNFQLFDLTRMFGAGNEPSTVAEFEALYPLSYYAYDAGTVKPASVSGVKAVGLNLLNLSRNTFVTSGDTAQSTKRAFSEDQIWVGLTMNNYLSSGAVTSYAVESDRLSVSCSNNGYGLAFPLRVTPNTTLYCDCDNANPIAFGFYDEDGAWLSFGPASGVPLSPSGTITTPNNCHWMTVCFRPLASDGVLHYVHPIINISGPRNGTYRPYTTDTITLNLPPLHGIGSACDEQRETERVTRIGSVDLGTLSWSYAANNKRFQAYISTKAADASYVYPKLVCTAFQPVTDVYFDQNLDVDKIIRGSSTAGYIFVRDLSYTDATLFKNAVSGVYLYYELATPTTTPTDPPLLMQYSCEPGGTETILTDGISAPPTLTVLYSVEAADIADSIAPTESRVSSANYASGSLVMLGGTLVRVTSPVASGEEFKIGTNCTTTTFAAELAAAE